MKISRPDISNAVRELSRHMHKATTEHVKALNHLNKYILNTADKGIQLYHSDGHLLEIIGYADSNYGNDPETHHSVSGFVIYLNKSLISWKSKLKPITTLSSTEAEYIALAMCLAEVLFIFAKE